MLPLDHSGGQGTWPAYDFTYILRNLSHAQYRPNKNSLVRIPIIRKSFATMSLLRRPTWMQSNTSPIHNSLSDVFSRLFSIYLIKSI